jgi:hypothetical protein
VNEADRFLHPIVPPLALALVGFLDGLGSGRLTTAAAAVVAAQLAAVSLQSLWSSVPRSVGYSPDVPERKSALASELDRIIRLTCTGKTAGKINVVGTDYPWLNHVSLEFIAFSQFARRDRRCYWASVGFAERDPRAAWQQLNRFQSPFYVTVDYGNPRNLLPPALRARAQETLTEPDAFNQTNIAVFRRALRSGEWLVVPGFRHLGLIVLRRAP